MILSELISEFRTIIELDSSGLPGLTDEEIILFIDNAQNAIINQRLQGHTLDKTKYPDTQKRVDDLNSLYRIADVSGTTIGSGTTNNYFDFQLSQISEYMHFDQATLKVSIPHDLSEHRYKMDDIPFHKTDRVEYSNINEPYIEKPVYCILTSSTDAPIIRTYFDLYDAKENGWVMTLEVGYIKTPTNLKDAYETSSDYAVTDFSYSTYKEIVRKATDEAISIISPKRTQVSQQQLNKSE